MKVPVLCQCGWGCVMMEEDKVPVHCPKCGFNLHEWAEEQNDDDGEDTIYENCVEEEYDDWTE